MSSRALPGLMLLTGAACILIGAVHLILGITSVPGEALAGPTVDSRERFYGAIFAGYGLAWVWAARQPRTPTAVVRVLAGLFLLGGTGRLISLAVRGWPQWFQVVLTVVEFGLPALFFWLTRGDRRGGNPATGPHQRIGETGQSS